MNPLCTLRYSATHVDKHHMVFRLDAVDAYERKLVKQIEVASATVEGGHNKPYVRLVSVSNKRGVISAKVELDVQTAQACSGGSDPCRTATTWSRRRSAASTRTAALAKSGVARGNEFLELRVPGGEHLPQARPGVGRRGCDWPCSGEMIRRTIKEHLDKEKRLAPAGHQGAVASSSSTRSSSYRQYDETGTP